jgi:transcriptional regulator with XRE-family HTH domain
MSRKRDSVVDKKIGALVRMQRVKLGTSQTELGEAPGVTLQQVQKYERGSNSVASSRVPDLCRILEISPDELFNKRSDRAEASSMLAENITVLSSHRRTPARRRGG